MEKINVKRHPRVLQEKRLHAMIKSDPQYEYIYLASYSLCTMYIRHVVIGQLTILGPDRLLMSVMENSGLLFSCGHLQLAIFR